MLIVHARLSWKHAKKSPCPREQLNKDDRLKVGHGGEGKILKCQRTCLRTHSRSMGKMETEPGLLDPRPVPYLRTLKHIFS